LPEGACQKCYFPDPAKLDKPALRETVRLVEKCGSYELTTIEAMCLMKFWATCMDESGARCGDGTFVIDFAAARIDQLRVSVGRHQFADVLERWSPGADTKDAREICRKIYREPVEEW
jgi:hypothetical protein